MAITDFASLKTAISARAIRSDLTSYIPDFVRSAHDEIVNTLCLSTDLTLSSATISLPSDFRAAVMVLPDTNPASPLEFTDTDGVTNLGSGAPRYGNISGSTLTVAPSPDITYTARLLYRLSRTMFSADADTNTALTRYPFLYLDGAMAELFAHTRNTDEETKYRQKFEAGLERANSIERESFWGSAPLQPIPAMVV